MTVNTDAGGTSSWNVVGLPPIPAGSFLTATATVTAGLNANTSEFSACKVVAGATSGLIVVSPTSLITTESGGTAQFTVVLGIQPADTVTVGLTSTDLTEGAVTVPITIAPDGFPEPDETFTVRLSNASGATIEVAQATVTIRNEDGTSPGGNDPPDPPSGKSSKNDHEASHRETETERQGRERTNASNLDDYRAEGNVVAVDLEASPRTATIATRDGLQVIVLLCRDSCQDPHVGDYLEADGVKENELLFYADGVSSRSTR